MKKNILFFLFIFSSYFLFSQTEKFNLAFIYKVKAKFYKDKIEENADENMVLLVGKKNSLYISPYRYKLDSARMAIKTRKGSVYELIDLRSTLPRYKLHESIFKEFKNNFLHNDWQSVNLIYRIEEKIPNFSWKIENEYKTILNYKCQLATLNYKGRNYNAWFTTQIPIQNGPWKFGGLPGLIVKIIDKKEEFSFELIGVFKKEQSYIRNTSRKIIVKDKDFLKSVRNYYKLFFSEIQDGESKTNLRRKINKKIKLLEIKNKIELE